MATPKHPLWETSTDYADRKRHEMMSRGCSYSDAQRAVNKQLDEWKRQCGWG